MGGLVIFPGGWPPVPEAMYGPDPEDEDQMKARICAKIGHEVHVCPACADRMCLRCGLGLNP